VVNGALSLPSYATV